MKVLFIIGILLALFFALTYAYVVVCEILELKHPSEDAVVHAFIKIAGVYFVISLIFIIGHLGELRA